MTVTINGTTGISSDAGYSSDGVSFADGTPSNTLVTTTGGNVGIGTSSPTYPLDVVAPQVRISSSSGLGVRQSFNSTSTNGRIWQIGSNFSTGNGEFAIYDATASAERARIDSSGSLRTYAANPLITGTSNAANSSSANAIFQGRYSATSTTGGGTDCIFITSNGNIYNTNGTYGTLSDAKLKENIVDAASQWDDIKALRVRNFNFKEGQTHTQIGYIAQEVEAVSPSLVDTSSDVDAEGNELETTTKSLKLSVINIKAVKALQEAMERIERMEAEIAALKGQQA